jgi:hypothetical protein
MADVGVGASALARLDHDILELEQRLAELRAMRKSAEPFIEQYLSRAADEPGDDEGEAAAPRVSLTDQVVNVFENYPDEEFDVDEVTATLLRDSGVEASREAVRNAIHYARRLGRVTDVRRGQFKLGDP